MTASSPSRALLACAIVTAVLAAAPASAQTASRDDRFTVRLSAFNPEASLRLEGSGTATDGTDTTTFDDGATLGLGDDWRPRGSVGFRISERQRLIGNFYDYENDASRTSSGSTIDPADGGLPGDPLDLPAGAVDARLEFRLASINYEYAVLDTETLQWGLGLGATHARVATILTADYAGTADLEPWSGRHDWNESSWSPNVHTRLAWAPSGKWRLSIEGQYLDGAWGNLLEDGGHFERGGVLAEYMISERVGIHVGYDWFRLKMGERFDGTVGPFPEAGVGPVDYEGKLTGSLKVHGPMVGVTFAF